MNMHLEPLPGTRLKQAKWAYTTRRIKQDRHFQLLSGAIIPEAGDLVLARVEELGQHKRLELVSSRRARLFEGDEIVVAYGARYAPRQFEAVVPTRLEPCHLVAGGGIADHAEAGGTQPMKNGEGAVEIPPLRGEGAPFRQTS